MGIAAPLVLLAAVASVVMAWPAMDEEKAVRDLWESFEQAFNEYDAAKVAELYAPDADRVDAGGEWACGRSEIRRQYESELERRKADPSVRPFQPTIRLRFVRPDVAMIDGEWDWMRSGRIVRGQFTVVASKEKGSWWITSGRVRALLSLPSARLSLRRAPTES
jgi:uncharacterized protein (TIGR02246 family)